MSSQEVLCAQIETSTNNNISKPVFNGTTSEDDEPNPAILYSALKSDTIDKFGSVKPVFYFSF